MGAFSLRAWKYYDSEEISLLRSKLNNIVKEKEKYQSDSLILS